MAVLTNNARRDLWRAYMQEMSAQQQAVGPITKADLRAAVDALDDFLNTNAAAINQAIPQPARSALTVPQKARLLIYVVERRSSEGA